MAFTRPTLSKLIERAQSDTETRLPGAQPRLRNSMLGVLARVHPGANHGLYGHLDWIARQIIYDTADTETLDRAAGLWLQVPRKAAVAAAGPVTLTGTTGSIVPAGTRLAAANGEEYETAAEVTLAAGTATAQVTALTAGQSGNLAAGTALALVSPIAGVNAQATVAAGGLVGGADQETDASLLARLKARIQRAPHGGSRDDYITWALEVAGVTRAWCYPKEQGIGTVTVRFVRDDDASIIPDAAEVAAVQAYIEARYPVNGDVFVVAPIPIALNLTIRLTPNTSAVQAAVQAEIADLLRREAEPGGTILISHIREAISLAAGETNHVLTIPAADVTHTTGQIAVMGAITWA
ncbi:MAG: baseplate J/gp47 family protein [Betaproteobacteria bacterium]|nr:baseplate J/gp47 family protein [Betaproteobacteria bacterium]